MLWSVTCWTVKCSKFPCLVVGWMAQELLWLCCAHWRRDPHRKKMGTTLSFGHWIRALTSQTGSPQRCQQIQLYKLSRSTQSHSLLQFYMSWTTKCPEIFVRFLTCGRLLNNCQSAMNATRATQSVAGIGIMWEKYSLLKMLIFQGSATDQESTQTTKGGFHLFGKRAFFYSPSWSIFLFHRAPHGQQLSIINQSILVFWNNQVVLNEKIGEYIWTFNWLYFQN